ncbi:histidine phosphatase family protein [soil metagenome]
MAASLLHLVRHGEVHNPEGILYGRLAGFGLTELGKRMAAAAAKELAGHDIRALYSSPLQRAQESAAPWAADFDLSIRTDERLIEPTNRFEGGTTAFGIGVLLTPRVWPWIINPWRPSWGEPYAQVIQRMLSILGEAWAANEGEVVLVSHQMPIVMVQRRLAGKRPMHDPRSRRCHLSSITTLRREGDGFVEVGYRDVSSELLAQSIDEGAV